MKRCLKLYFLLLPLATASYALEPLSDESLQQVEAQAGADLSLQLSLNHRLENGKYVFDTGANNVCSAVEYCRLAISLNKRFIGGTADNPASWVPNSETGRKVWLVMKGIQGTINVQRLGIDGAELDYSLLGGQKKVGLKMSFDSAKPIQIRNFGFNALALEQDSFNTTATTTIANEYAGNSGYLKVNTYQATAGANVTVTNQVHDHGKETGFIGMMMNGDLHMRGNIMMFGCDSSHPRC